MKLYRCCDESLEDSGENLVMGDVDGRSDFTCKRCGTTWRLIGQDEYLGQLIWEELPNEIDEFRKELEMEKSKELKESRSCPVCGKQFLTETEEKLCEACRKSGKLLLNE